ncbi:VOC family protein [Pelagibacterium sp. H642]|uniref:VOC family protein n=1 Tax=Pelagibacterium sp. H642 TaxID=1881069 RepID=UPI002814BE87|nr:VOC family protein [Pelagibacterium sp. H642]WMT92329.1 VOC family protein [Pelagibacterium sp. H642]
MLFTARYTSLVFNVTDLDRTEKFYSEIMGIRFERRGFAGEQFLHAKLSENFEIDFMVGTPTPGNSPIMVFDLDEGGISDIVASLAEQGVTIVSPVGDAPDGKGATFRDPDDFAIGLYQANDKPLSLKGADK